MAKTNQMAVLMKKNIDLPVKWVRGKGLAEPRHASASELRHRLSF